MISTITQRARQISDASKVKVNLRNYGRPNLGIYPATKRLTSSTTAPPAWQISPSISHFKRSTMSTATASLPFSTPHPTLTDLLSTDDPFHSGMADMQSPGAGPSRSGRPVRASRPTSFKSYLSHMDEDEEQERGSDSGMDTDGDGDEYQAPAEEDGNDDDDHEADEDAEGELDDAYLSDTYPLPTSQQSRSFTRNGSATPKRRPAAARNMVIFQGSVDPSELRTVGINGVPPPPDTTRSRSASRSLPPSRTEKKFKCTWEGCGKAYTKPARLREHELSHTGEVRTTSTFLTDL